MQAECRRVEADNEQLSSQVAQLKKRLVELEVRNGSKWSYVIPMYDMLWCDCHVTIAIVM